MPQTQTFKFQNEEVDVADVGTPQEKVVAKRPLSNPFAPGSSLTTAPGAGTATSSSGAFGDAVSSLGSTINTAATNAPTTSFLTEDDVARGNEAKAAAKAQYDEQQKRLEEQRKQAVAEIEAQFGRAEQSLGQAQRGETGSSSMGLARIGGFDSASGQAVLTNLAVTQRAEMQALQDKRSAAVSAAQNAYNDKQFAAARQYADDVKDIDKEIYDRAKDFANYTLQLRSAARQDAQFNLDIYKEQRQQEKDDLARAQSIQKFAEEQGLLDKPFIRIGKTAYDMNTGKPVTLEQYQELTGQQVGLPESETDFSQISVVDIVAQSDKEFVEELRKDYPDAGITATDSADAAARKLSNSKIYKDKVRGPVGDTKSVKKEALFMDITEGINQFKQAAKAVDPNYDGYLPPDMYRQLRDRARSVLGSASAFESEFPVFRYVAPDNRVEDLFFRNDEQTDEGID